MLTLLIVLLLISGLVYLVWYGIFNFTPPRTVLDTDIAHMFLSEVDLVPLDKFDANESDLRCYLKQVKKASHLHFGTAHCDGPSRHQPDLAWRDGVLIKDQSKK